MIRSSRPLKTEEEFTPTPLADILRPVSAFMSEPLDVPDDRFVSLEDMLYAAGSAFARPSPELEEYYVTARKREADAKAKTDSEAEDEEQSHTDQQDATDQKRQGVTELIDPLTGQPPSKDGPRPDSGIAPPEPHFAYLYGAPRIATDEATGKQEAIVSRLKPYTLRPNQDGAYKLHTQEEDDARGSITVPAKNIQNRNQGNEEQGNTAIQMAKEIARLSQQVPYGEMVEFGGDILISGQPGQKPQYYYNSIERGLTSEVDIPIRPDAAAALHSHPGNGLTLSKDGQTHPIWDAKLDKENRELSEGDVDGFKKFLKNSIRSGYRDPSQPFNVYLITPGGGLQKYNGHNYDEPPTTILEDGSLKLRP